MKTFKTLIFVANLKKFFFSYFIFINYKSNIFRFLIIIYDISFFSMFFLFVLIQ